MAVVIGGTSGIGRAMALGLARQARTSSAPVAASSRWTKSQRRSRRIGRRSRCAKPYRPDRPRPDRNAAGQDGRSLRQGRHPGQLRRQDQAHTHADRPRSRVDRHHGHQPDRHAARLPGLRQAHDRQRLRPHHQHRIAEQLRRAGRGGRLRRQQGRCRLADTLARGGMVQARRATSTASRRASSAPT